MVDHKMTFLTVHQLAFVFGLLGNIVSFLVFLAPAPTFLKIYRAKSSSGYQCVPYVVALSSAMLLLYYAFLKTNAYMIVSINGIGCVIEVTYIIIYILYSPIEQKISTLKLIGFANVGVFGVMMLFVNLMIKHMYRVTIVGWICAIYNLLVFAAPLSIMAQVIRTKSVEYMPFLLSFFLTLCAAMWFFYGFLINDYYIALPNVVGFLLAVSQMILYMIYKNAKKNVNDESNEHEVTHEISMNGVNKKRRISLTNNKLEKDVTSGFLKIEQNETV